LIKYSEFSSNFESICFEVSSSRASFIYPATEKLLSPLKLPVTFLFNLEAPAAVDMLEATEGAS
jgi:hypothetical protein